MKRLLILALTLLLCCALLTPAAHADVIWEPTENSFYDTHAAECVYQDKSYTVPQDTPAYEAPGDANPLFTLPAGDTAYVGFAYTDASGKTWGAVDGRQGDEWISGWVDLTQLTPIYDSRDFLTDHADEITPYAGTPAQLDADGDWMLWKYPGSETGYPFTPDDSFSLDWAESVYTDPTGDQWLYFPYVFGVEGWVYVPDPCRTTPIPLELPTPESTATPTAQPTEESASTGTAQATGGPSLLTTVLLVIVCASVLLVAVISAVLIAVFYPRKKK